MRLCVGQASLSGKLSRYAQNFNFLELRADVGSLPRPPRLREYRAQVRAGFGFSILSPLAIANLEPGEETDAALSYAEKAAEALGAEWFVLQTGIHLSPSEAGRGRLRAAVSRLQDAGLRLAWEPRGPWAEEQAEEFSAELGLALVRDLTLDEPMAGPVVYTRIRAIGFGGRITSGAMERVGERLAEASEAYVVVEGASAKGLAKHLKHELLEGELGVEAL